MYNYSVNQWILLFFAYGFVGYLWEIFYVSIRAKRFCNRGFLKGPILPIYSFGAVILLHVLIPVSSNYVLMYIVGCIASTALELFTGWAMEKIFCARYWDYSQNRFNLNGYICLSVSLAWGIFGIILMKFIHPAFDVWVRLFSDNFANISSHILLLAFGLDVAWCVREALDLRKLIKQLEAAKEQLQKRADAVIAFSDMDQNGIPDEIDELILTAKQRKENLVSIAEGKKQQIRRRADAVIAFSDMDQNGIPDSIDFLIGHIEERLFKIRKSNPTAVIKMLKKK